MARRAPDEEQPSPRTSQPPIELEPIDTTRRVQSFAELLTDVKEELRRSSTSIVKSARTKEHDANATKARPEEEPEDEGIDFEKAFQGRVSIDSMLHSASEASSRPILDPDNPFHKLPDELIYRIFVKLEERDLGRAARVSRKWHALAFDPLLWRLMSKRWHLLSAESLTPSRHNPTRAFYVERYKRYKVLQLEALAIQEAEAMRRTQLERLRRRIARVRRAEDVLRVTLFNRVADYLSYFGILLGTIFVVLRLDHRIMWPWLLVFIPFAFPLFHIFFSLIAYDLVRCIFGNEVHANLNGTLGEHTGQGHALAHVFSLMRGFRIETYICVFSVVATGIMIWYKVSTRSLGLPWWVVLFPVTLASFVLLLATIFGNRYTRTAGQFLYPPIWRAMHFVDRGCMSYYSVITILTLVFITLMLHQYVTWTWWVALSPIWAMAAGCVLTPLFYLCVSFVHCSDGTVLLGDRSTACICWLSTWLFFLGPFLAFVILVASNLSKWQWRTWAAVFAPVFVLEVLLFCVCVAYDIVILSDD